MVQSHCLSHREAWNAEAKETTQCLHGLLPGSCIVLWNQFMHYFLHAVTAMG